MFTNNEKIKNLEANPDDLHDQFSHVELEMAKKLNYLETGIRKMTENFLSKHDSTINNTTENEPLINDNTINNTQCHKNSSRGRMKNIYKGRDTR